MKQFRLSRELVKVSIALALALVSVLSTLAIGFFVREDQRLEAERLTRANLLLEDEVRTIRTQLSTLEQSLDQLSSKDEHYRLLAGLDPIDADVRQAGIGGPGLETPQSTELWRVDASLGNLAFGTRDDLNTLLRRARLLESSWSEATSALESDREFWARRPSILPTPGVISSGFAKRRVHPILHVARPHKGMDVVASMGTPIMASARGRVIFVGRRGDYGLMVEVDHGHGFVTRYAHASKVLVRRGQVVERGEKIAEVGRSGLVTAPSLHYEVLVNGRAQDPNDYIVGDVLPF